MGNTLAQKIWNRHLVISEDSSPDVIYIDLHLVNEVTSPQAFSGLELNGRTVRRPDLTIAVEDHNVPTIDVHKPIDIPTSALQVQTLRDNCEKYGIPLHRMGEAGQGIVHVIGPELGITQPGMTIVCGDSHTSTHGAFGALAFGIGTSEVEHVLATQTLSAKPFRTMAVNLNGVLRPGVSSKDVILNLISKIGTGGGQGYVLEYRGSAVDAMSMEARMTMCNMSIEAGARAGLIAPDTTTLDYIRGREHAPNSKDWSSVSADWLNLASDEDAIFDAEVTLDVGAISAFVTWGTNPGQGVALDGMVPSPEDFDIEQRLSVKQALAYMDLEPGTPMKNIHVDVVFLGSCTNGRIEDLRLAASVLEGRKVKSGLRMLVVPGSMLVRRQAEEEGLDDVFLQAGAEWRFAGCSMCLGMNPDQVRTGQRAASTSNRNFEGRQGQGSRTHLVSPLVAAATAVRGTLSSPDDLI